MQLVLSTFTGVGLLDQAFREKGFVVVSVGDLITGQDIRDFTGIKNKFEGVIGGPPCPGFSSLKRNKLPNLHPDNYSFQMMKEFIRILEECQPDWYLMENVKGVPNVTDLIKNSVTQLHNYSHQRFDINQGWYDEYSRLRHIQFGSKSDLYLNIPRGKMNNIKSSCALASDDRSFKELCHIQGLPDDYNLPSFNVAGKKRAVGNGVPLSMGRVLAKEVKRVTDPGVKNVTDQINKFVTDRESNNVTLQQQDDVTDQIDKFVTPLDKIKRCICGRPLIGNKKTCSDACRKRLSRNNKKQQEVFMMIKKHQRKNNG